MTEEKDKPEVPTEAYNEFIDRIDLAIALLGGTYEMRKRDEQYLPKEEKESQKSYDNRLSRSILLDAYERTCERFTGEIFRKPVDFADSIFPEFDTMKENIDMAGTDIQRFLKSIFFTGVSKAVCHVLIDMPKIQTRENSDGVKFYFDEKEPDQSKQWKRYTLEEQKRNNFRAKWIKIDPEDIIGWRTEVVNGIIELTQIRIKEVHEEAYGAYGTATVNRIRVLEPGRYEIFQEDSEGKYFSIENGTTGYKFIPLCSFIIGEKLTHMTAELPLDGLAWLNLMHWQSSSDQRNILHYARLVTYFGKMLSIDEDDDKLVIGSNRIVKSEAPEGDLKVVEHSGKAIDSGRTDLLDLENQMAMFGLTYMMNRSGNMTATERAINSAESDSSLISWALYFEKFIEYCIFVTATMIGASTDGIKVVVNTDFKTWTLDKLAEVLLKAYLGKLLPKKLVIEEFQRRGIIKDELDFIDIMEMFKLDQMNDMSFQDNTGGIPNGSPQNQNTQPDA